MHIRLNSTEILKAVELYLTERFVKSHKATITLTEVAGKNYGDPNGFVIEADIELPEDVAEPAA